MPDRVSDIGEFGLIRKINDLLKKEGVQSKRVTLGVGDDTASFLPRSGYEVLVTCDCMVEGRHFLPGRFNFLDLGQRAMALNISDIGAMGGKPLYALVSLGLKDDILIKDIEKMYRGFLLELNPFQASIVGGNLTKSGDGMFVDITLIGEVKKGKAVRRSGAKPGDTIFVTGHPGQAAAGLQLLLQMSGSPDINKHPLVKIYNTPSHRAPLGASVAKAGCATAMIDTSDGFLGDLGHICEASGVGAELMQDKIPISDDLRKASLILKRDPYDLFLGESDDYELIITSRPEKVSRLCFVASQYNSVPLTEVGKVIDHPDEIILISPEGRNGRSNRQAGTTLNKTTDFRH